MNRIKALATVAAAAVVLGACGGGGESRADVVIPIVSTAVPARYAAFATSSAELAAEIGSWCDTAAAAPTAAIEAAQTEWYQLKPFWAGPVMERRSQYLIDARIDESDIDALLASDDPVDAETLRDVVGADQRGLAALLYLSGGEPDTRRCEYATGIVDLVSSESGAVADDWALYGPALVTDDTSANDALRDIVSNSVFALRQIEQDGTVAIEDGLLEGARWAVLGDADTEGTGITELLSDDTVEQLTTEFDQGDAMAAALTLSTNVVAELGLTLNFSDADGDGG